MTKFEAKNLKDENEKYSCNKENVLEDYKEEQEHINSMKKKQRDIAIEHKLVDHMK